MPHRHTDPFDFDRSCEPPLRYVHVEEGREASRPLSEEHRGELVVHTVHDGGAIPWEFRFRPDGEPLIPPALLKRRYIEERDWGANMVAEELATALALPGYARVEVARVLVDFNRFPGSTPPDVDHPLESLAISHPYSEILDHRSKQAVLERYYDPINDLLEEHFAHKRIAIAIHTYDEHHPSTLKRADVSIISQPRAYMLGARMTYGVFDPLYPDTLAESTCSRILRDRISLNLERSGFRVSHNHPYPIPDGSIEMRAQVWFFFRYLRERFQEDHPTTKGDTAFELVWTMLLDTNLRLQEAEALRSYLHRFRKVPPDRARAFAAAQEAYERVKHYVRTSDVVAEFRRSPTRPSSFGIEVRKDLLCSFDSRTGDPLRPTEEQRAVAREIGAVVASALTIYYDTDLTYV